LTVIVATYIKHVPVLVMSPSGLSVAKWLRLRDCTQSSYPSWHFFVGFRQNLVRRRSQATLHYRLKTSVFGNSEHVQMKTSEF